MPDSTDLQPVREILQADHGPSVVATCRQDGSIQASVVSAGVMPHPVNGEPVVAFVARGGTVKLKHLRSLPQATVVFRSGGKWITVEGTASLAGPDDVLPGVPPERIPQLIRDIFAAAGGTHDDWPTFDRVMAEERRTGVLIEPRRIYGNAGSR